MGKVSKVVKTVGKTENKSKLKKLVNNPGVTKASAKLNLKDTRVPLTKILKNKPQIADKNETLIQIGKSLKKNKKFSESVSNSVELKLEQVPIMKTLKRKSYSENTVKLPIPKKKGLIGPDKKEPKMKTVEELDIEKKPEIKKQKHEKIDKKILKEKPEPQPQKTDVITIDKSQVLKGVSAVLKLAKLQDETKKSLFQGEHQPIFLQVSCIKVPKVPRRQLRMMLPHTLVTETDDVVLFVGDLKKGRAQDFEPTIIHYKDLLQEHGCTQIKDVIPLTQVKTEYDQYELKRKLLSSYDYFLTDGKIAGHLSHLLGKIFIMKRKLPTSVKMGSKNLKKEIDNALKKTSLQLHSNGNSHTVQVAHTAMKKQEILNNVLNVCKNLAQNYPGGWINIRSLILKTSNSLPVPIYITLKSKNKVKVPVVRPTRPKAHRTVSGELSTAPGNTRVIVQADGTVEVLKIRGRNKEVIQKVDKLAAKKSKLVTQATNKSAVKKSKPNKKKTTSAEDTEENQSTKDSQDLSEPETKKFEDSEDEIEEAEQAYLSQWHEESITTSPQEKQPKKISKTIKKKKTKA